MSLTLDTDDEKMEIVCK